MTFSSQTFLSLPKAIAAGGLSIALVAPLVGMKPAIAASFSDVNFSYWARPFIEILAQYDIVNGYEDGSYRPEQAMTRAQFESLLDRSFGSEGGLAQETTWYENQPITRMQALVMLSNRLDLEPEGSVNSTLSIYKDAVEIPGYAREGIASATENRLVVNYPNVRLLRPYQAMTRADAAAFIHQGLVQQGQLEPINAVIKTSDYIVEQPQTQSPPKATAAKAPTVKETSQQQMDILPIGTEIPLEYPGGRDVNFVITPGETYETALAVAQPILDETGSVLIPEGSRVRGRFVPMQVNGTDSATQFVANRLILDDMSYAIRATSDLRMAVDQSEVEPTDLKTAITSAAAKSVVRSIEGKSTSFGNILVDTFGLNQNKQGDKNVIVISPDSLVLTTQTHLRMASR